MIARHLILAVAGVALSTVCVMAASNSANSKASPNLEQLKKLAGEWVEVGEDGQPTDTVVSSYRVTAGGSAVLEIIFPGTNHEMVTMYHEDGDDLVLTHYCVARNQPRMRAERDTGPKKLVFKCIGGTNMKSENDEHMHEGRLTFIDEDHIKSEWLQHTNGKNTYTASHELVRKAK